MATDKDMSTSSPTLKENRIKNIKAKAKSTAYSVWSPNQGGARLNGSTNDSHAESKIGLNSVKNGIHGANDAPKTNGASNGNIVNGHANGNGKAKVKDSVSDAPVKGDEEGDTDAPLLHRSPATKNGAATNGKKSSIGKPLDPTTSPWVPKPRRRTRGGASPATGSPAKGGKTNDDLRHPVARIPGSQSMPDGVGNINGTRKNLQSQKLDDHDESPEKHQAVVTPVLKSAYAANGSSPSPRPGCASQPQQRISGVHFSDHRSIYSTSSAGASPAGAPGSAISFAVVGFAPNGQPLFGAVPPPQFALPAAEPALSTVSGSGAAYSAIAPNNLGDYAVAPLPGTNGYVSSAGHTIPNGDPFVTAPNPSVGHVQAPANYGHNNGTLIPHPAYQDGSALQPQVQPPPQGQLQYPQYPAPSRSLSVYIPQHVRSERSPLLNHLTSSPTGLPTAAEACDKANFPFVASTQQVPQNCSYGVIKLKNIPFGTTRSEIVALLGRNSKILNDNLEPVHIIMERVTSKTNDAYVEFLTLQDAMKAVERCQMLRSENRQSKIGDRPVEVQLSSQGALMKDLFPLATGVFWENTYPAIQKDNPAEPWTNFKGFITDEEMCMLVKHVEVPQRSPFSRDCPQRPFECMISTLRKLPWHMTAHITIRQRHAIYRACRDLIKLLGFAINHHRNDGVLNPPLRNRLIHAAMNCPGFTVVQKDDIAWVAGLDEGKKREYGLPRFASSWVHLYGLTPKPNTPLDVIEYYIAVIREQSTYFIDNSFSVEQRDKVWDHSKSTDPYFGFLWWLLSYPDGEAFDDMTLSTVISKEIQAITTVLEQAFGSHRATYPSVFATS